MRQLIISLILAVGLWQPAKADESLPEIHISDVELFFRVYDAANGSPSARALQTDYLDAGSDGLRQFIPHRIISATELADAISKHRDTYEQARTCAVELPDVRQRLAAVLEKLGEIYPEARFPPITMVIGRGSSGGTTGRAGVLIGIETVCGADWLQADVGDRLVHLIAHEYAHVQQPIVESSGNPSDGQFTVLQVSLVEGVAELLAELTSGSISNVHLQRYAAGREREIERAFLDDINKTDLSAWLYNGRGTPERPGDLGYWVGYRIAKQFYQRSPDKRAAIRELIAAEDPQDILRRSGWVERVRPAIR
ncbi:MAG TPA: DUF2268 domain-containing putative Zn-dependent protease [Steroidobacter sp.]|uniref:DUF2268 domain-containing putative Zn-dependent protease n=1 Tax=Steroidobacter sp. TaxID=1978227 RepID=UPI002ED87F63